MARAALACRPSGTGRTTGRPLQPPSFSLSARCPRRQSCDSAAVAAPAAARRENADAPLRDPPGALCRAYPRRCLTDHVLTLLRDGLTAADGAAEPVYPEP